MKVTDRSSVQKNAVDSILLKAPAEVLDNILKFVLGNGMIHVKFLHEEAFRDILLSESKDPKTIPEDGGLCAAFCVAEKSEQAAYNEANLNAKDVQASEDPDTVETCEQRHKECLMCGKHDKAILVTGLQGERLSFANNLSVLAVCRQLYEESNKILWQSNTFSFDEPESFTRFVGSMNPAQKSKLGKVHLSLNVPIDESGRWHFEMWAKAIPGRILTSLKAVKVLNITFDQYSICNPRHDPTDKVSHTRSQFWVTETMNHMLGLRMLPWKDKYDTSHGKHVTVVISDDASTHLEALTPRWFKASKLETAEAFRALLADPNSAETHKAYTAAAKIKAAERKLREERQDRIDKIQDAIDNLQPRVKSAEDEYQWRVDDREQASDKVKNPLKKYAPISDYQRYTAMNSAKKRFDELDLKMYCLKADLERVRKDPKYLSLKETSEDSGDEQGNSGDDQDNSGHQQDNSRDQQDNSGDDQSSSSEEEEGPSSPITSNEFIRWLRGPIPY